MKTNEWKQRVGVAGTILLMYLWVSFPSAWGQASTSRLVPFNNVSTTIAPGTTGQTFTLQLWDALTAGNQLYCENQTLDVTPGPDGVTGVIAFDFGAGVVPPVPCPSGPPELKPGDFVSGQSRFLDVVDPTGASVLPSGLRIPFKAVAFAINPGPQGPAGPTGSQGPQGVPGVVQTVTAADTSVTVSGTAQDRVVAVAPNGITNSHISNGALSPAKIAGIAATLGPNNFIGDQATNGNLSATGNLSAAGNLVMADSGAAAGNLLKSGTLFLHNFGTDNTFVGKNAGNLTTSGSGRNSAIGVSALQSNTTGAFNTASGFASLLSNDAGSFNTATGENSLLFNTGGSNNTATGLAALYRNTTGSNNTALGYAAGLTSTDVNANTTGSNNTFIGYQAGPGTSMQLTNAAAIGANALVSASNALVLGGTGANAVKVGIGTPTPSFTLDVNGTGNFSGAVTANSFSGNGSGLTGVTTSGLAAGTYGNAYTFSNAGNSFTGNGSGLTSVTASGLAPGNYTGAYHFINGLSTFVGGAMTASSMSAGNLSASGNISAGNISTSNLSASRTISVGISNPDPTINLDVAGVTRVRVLDVPSTLRIGGDAPMSSAPHMNFFGTIPGTLCRDSSCNVVDQCGGCIASYFRPDRDIQITRISFLLNSSHISPSCSMHDIYIAFNPSFFTTGTRVPLPVDAGFGDSGPLSVNVNSGQEVWLVTWVGQCTVGTSAGGGLIVNVQYVMR